MKKITPALQLILIALLFIGCTSDEANVDNALLAQVQGKWKLTQYVNDTPFILNYPNGPVMELKADGTFTSDEEGGYSNGTYTVLKSPGKNLRLVFLKQWSAKVVYKYINSVTANNLYLQGSNPEPTPDGVSFFEGYTFTRIP
ncbi:hypothetical protein [Flavobacterium sp. N1994]|uniref:hypothetical protein n=1 Tax=Flavobacterium sp. N1994 TaxID=2986827 RepID=UPI0022227D8D|nr:hypothetical protein [Flavobacterium sp. N1994]